MFIPLVNELERSILSTFCESYYFLESAPFRLNCDSMLTFLVYGKCVGEPDFTQARRRLVQRAYLSLPSISADVYKLTRQINEGDILLRTRGSSFFTYTLSLWNQQFFLHPSDCYISLKLGIRFLHLALSHVFTFQNYHFVNIILLLLLLLLLY